jgi:hypothetical protein
MVGMNLTKVHCKHIWKCHRETTCTYTNKNVFKKEYTQMCELVPNTNYL